LLYGTRLPEVFRHVRSRRGGPSSRRTPLLGAIVDHSRERTDGRLSHRLEDAKARDFDRLCQERARLFQKESGLRLASGTVVDPEENDPHLIEPEEVGKIAAEIGRRTDVRSFEGRPEMADALVADLSSLLTERGKRTRGVACAAKERSQELAVGLKLLDL